MSITVNSKTYNEDSALNDGNTVVYAGPAHDFQNSDTLVVKRQAPKRTATFAGVARSEQKFTETQVLDAEAGKKHPAIFAASTSLPVGMTEAAFDAMQATFAAYVASATFKNVAFKHDLKS